MKYILSLALGLCLIGSASAAGQFGNSGSPSVMVGAYADGLGGIFKYTVPISIDGMSRSGLGLVAEGQLGGGISESDFNMSSMVGANLVFITSSTMDFYGGLGFGTRLLPESSIGIGGQIGINFVANNTRLFTEAGAHPGGISYLGIGMRF